MAFTAADVKNLREMTGCGMMDCKKALTETDGDIDKAVEYLREKGLASQAKKASRIAAEGMAYAWVCEKCGTGVCVEVNCETDFVANGEPFQNFVKGVAQVIASENPADVDALLNCAWIEGNGTVSDAKDELFLALRENMSIRRFARMDTGICVPYVHMKGKIGVLVNLEVSDDIKDNEKVIEVGKDVAMQIAALNPRFWDKSLVTEAILEEEKNILVAQMDNDPKMASKPAAVKEKIAAGKMNKFYEENCLLQQDFVKDNSMSVEQYIASAAKALGGTIKFVDAVRYEKGEGIEKRQDNLAEEVAKMVK